LSGEVAERKRGAIHLRILAALQRPATELIRMEAGMV
jgi:hypothetical protein